MHAARLLADHPDVYAGAISNSPGPLSLLPEKLANPAITGPLILSIGDSEHPNTVKGVKQLESLWHDAGRPVRVIPFHGGHQLPPDWEKMFRDALEQFAGTS
jgi:predicted esterase